MKAGWEIRKLGEVLDVQNGYAFDSKNFSTDGLMPLIRIRDLKKGTSTETKYSGSYDPRYVVHKGDLLIGMDGEFGCHEWNGNPALLNQRVCRLQNCNEKLLKPKFLLYGINAYLKEIEEVTGYTTVKHLSSKQILNISFPIPPLSEQEHIVGILDEAFASIATAKANTQKNLENAKAVFESHLNSVFSKRGEGWTEQEFEACVTNLPSPSKIQRKDFLEAGLYPIVSQEVGTINGYWDASDDLVSIPKPVIVFGDHTKIVKFIDFDFVRGADGTKIFETKPFLEPKFFYYQLLSVPLPNLGYARHYRLLREVTIRTPPLREQMQIVRTLDSLTEETSRLTSLYTQKLSALEDLKKSLLHQAFTGKL
jgi:type I restriction enzyme S subunit